MNKDIAEKWAVLLESNEFAQSSGKLRRTEGYCCLGVLCELYRRETGQGMWVECEGDNTGMYDFQWLNNQRRTDVPATLLPPVVQAWAGMRDNAGSMAERSLNKTPLYRSNDDKVPFKQIAYIIRENVNCL